MPLCFSNTAEKVRVEKTNTLSKTDRGLPAQASHATHVEKLLRRAIGFGSIELERALEADCLCNQFGQFPDGQILAAADIDQGRQ